MVDSSLECLLLLVLTTRGTFLALAVEELLKVNVSPLAVDRVARGALGAKLDPFVPSVDPPLVGVVRALLIRVEQHGVRDWPVALRQPLRASAAGAAEKTLMQETVGHLPFSLLKLHRQKVGKCIDSENGSFTCSFMTDIYLLSFFFFC